MVRQVTGWTGISSFSGVFATMSTGHGTDSHRKLNLAARNRNPHSVLARVGLFKREDEANYIAYLACSQSDALEFQYSGALMAWIYSTNLLWEYAPDVYQELQDSLRLEVRKDLKDNTEFWDRYDGAVAKVAGKVNDTYLKANKQMDGVESYDRMVDLLMADYLS